MKKVLISPVGGQVAFGIIEYFKNNGHTVIGMDTHPEATGRFFCDAFHQVPRVGDAGYKTAVLDIISTRHVDLFVSWLDPEIMFWNEQYYLGGIPGEMSRQFAMAFRPDLREVYDKFLLHALLERHDIETPATRLLSHDESFASFKDPIVIKPRLGSGSRDTYIAETCEDAEYYRRSLLRRSLRLDQFLAQEFIDGLEYTVDVFALDGAVENAVIRSRREHRGVSLRGETVHDDGIERVVRTLCGALKMDGLSNIQLIRREGTSYVTDINLRPSGTIMFSINAGVDLLGNVIERIEGRDISRYGRPRLLKMARYLRELYYE